MLIEHVGTATPQVALEENRPVSETMERLAEYVRLVLDDFQESDTGVFCRSQSRESEHAVPVKSEHENLR